MNMLHVSCSSSGEGGPLTSAASTKNAAGTASLPDISYFDSYHDYDTHIQFLEDLQAAFPNNSDIFVAGQSYEDRPIQGIHLYGADGPGTKPAIVWHGTVHAREWIVTPVRPPHGLDLALLACR